MLLLIIVVQLLIIIEIRAQVSQNICLIPGYQCTENDDCCSNLCLSQMGTKYHYCEPENITSTVITTRENIKIIKCFQNDETCHSDVECCSNKCITFDRFFNSKICVKPNWCMKPGHYCITDSDCCSNKCYNLIGTRLHYCINKKEDLF
ncbi:uncharacterized protein LOC103569034 [Microplitis demolitor]|uniref:uncharacterized protein LOC103569034 n=1 Tax=Microplitis demolitor TaxID=69319 RepID=UPI0004CD08F9|nr:uncharacterized protein LOC103569034 [Microplitis demolitor]